MELKLILDGKEKTFRSGKITTRMFRRATEIRKAFVGGDFLGENYGGEDLDGAIDFIVEYFGKQFTFDDFLDGYLLEDSADFMVLFLKVLYNVQTNEDKAKVPTTKPGK